MSNVDEWDSMDFDELQAKKEPHFFLESRYMMHDLIKITSRKSSAKIITFYFRIPPYPEY